jgi:hypothetical protein
VNSLKSFAFSHIYMFKHSDPWVTTSGINQDVIKLLGNALHRDICGSDIPCLGFCSWNYVSGISIINTIVIYDSLYNAVRYSSGDQQPVEQRTTKSMPYEMRCTVSNIKSETKFYGSTNLSIFIF